MFRKILLILVLLPWHAAAVDDALLVVVIMVKNEAPVMVKTLEPFVKGGVKQFLIFDTGSTDGTQDIARDYFKEQGLKNAYVVEEPFIDFATSRNRALDEAECLFPDATFMIMPDAEWYMQNVSGLLDFCEHEKNESCRTCYHLTMRLISADSKNVLSFVVGRLLRTKAHVRFVGVVHEVLNHMPCVTIPEDSYFECQPCQPGREKSLSRWVRDKELLLKEYEKNPSDPRTVFYLAQTYSCLGDTENAYLFYKKRAAMVGWDEENFITHLRLGDVAQQLAVQNKQDDMYAVAIGHYLDAYACRPTRAESLVRIAQYYISKHQMSLAYLFAWQAVTIPYPEKDLLFVEKEAYDFVRYDLLGIAAWYVGEYKIGEWAVKKALAVQPGAPHLQRNLGLYQSVTM